MDIDEAAIDEGLYSRQLWAFFLQRSLTAHLSPRYVLGHEGILSKHTTLNHWNLDSWTSHEEDGHL